MSYELLLTVTATHSPMQRIIFCEYEKRDTEGLDFVPYPGELGQKILPVSARLAGLLGWRIKPCLSTKTGYLHVIQAIGHSLKRNSISSYLSAAPPSLKGILNLMLDASNYCYMKPFYIIDWNACDNLNSIIFYIINILFCCF